MTCQASGRCVNNGRTELATRQKRRCPFTFCSAYVCSLYRMMLLLRPREENQLFIIYTYVQQPVRTLASVILCIYIYTYTRYIYTHWTDARQSWTSRRQYRLKRIIIIWCSVKFNYLIHLFFRLFFYHFYNRATTESLLMIRDRRVRIGW